MQYSYTLLQKPEFMVDFLIDLMQFRVFIRHSHRDRYNKFKEVMDIVTFLIRDGIANQWRKLHTDFIDQLCYIQSAKLCLNLFAHRLAKLLFHNDF